MKKFLCLFISTILAAGMFSGCGGSSGSSSGDSESGEEITLTFWTHIEESWNESQDKIIAEFEAANPGIKIQREGFPYDEFEAKTQTSLLSQEGGADIYEIWGGWAIDFAPTGAFAAVPDEYMATIKEDSYEPVLGALEHEGKYYGIPMEFNIEYGGMLVSKPKFDELGLSYPTTWDEMIEDARKAAKSDGAVFETRGFDFVSWDTLPYTWLSMILSSGGQYWDGEKFTFSTPEGEKTMQTLVDYVAKDKLTNLDGLTNANEMEPYQWFFSGETLIAPRGPWVMPEGINDYGLEYGTDFEYVSMPFYGDEKLFASETGWGIAVNSASKKQEAAWKFIEFWTDPARMVDHNIACGMVPASKTAAHDPKFVEALPFMAPLVDILDGGRFIGYFNTDTLKEAVTEMYVDIVNNNRPVKEALDELDQRLNSQL